MPASRCLPHKAWFTWHTSADNKPVTCTLQARKIGFCKLSTSAADCSKEWHGKAQHEI